MSDKKEIEVTDAGFGGGKLPEYVMVLLLVGLILSLEIILYNYQNLWK
jgi:hypothetical protein